MSSSPVAGPTASFSNGCDRRDHAAEGQQGDMTHPPQVAVPVSPARGRVGRRRLLTIADTLSDRDLTILQTVSRFRVARGDQLRRLHFHTIRTQQGATRVCNRALQRLVERGAMHRLERRVGGVRAGSAGAVYAITHIGTRILAHHHTIEPSGGRRPHEPGAAFVNHALAVTETYAHVVEADRESRFELLTFDPEPDCWRTHTTALGSTTTVKPDAYVVVATGEFEHSTFVEIDLATEGRAALARKLRAYVAFHASGREQAEHDVFPHVLWLTPSKERAQVLASVVETLPPSARRLFIVTTSENALEAFTAEGVAT